MKLDGSLLLTRSEVAELLTLDECINAVETAFKLHAEGKVAPPAILGVHVSGGGFHIKAATMEFGGTHYFVAKTNANFPENAKKYDLPLIQGTIVLCDAENGYPLAVMDSIEISIVRTGAATAVAAKYLARADSKVATICGCGNQGMISTRTLLKVLPLRFVYAFDNDRDQATRFATQLRNELSLEAEVVSDLRAAVRKSDVCVTCTPSKTYFLQSDFVSPGTFVAAVGADNEEKQELEPALLVGNKVVVDNLEQCAVIGDLHHALTAGILNRSDVHAELGQVIAGMAHGRITDDEIVIFDSTGTALQDVASAVIVYQKALQSGTGVRLNFAA